MNRTRFALTALALASFYGATLFYGANATGADEQPLAAADLSKAADKEFAAGNFNDAYNLYRRLLLPTQPLPREDQHLAPQALSQAIQCLAQLGRIGEADALLEETVAGHSQNWLLLQRAAEQYLHNLPHYGFLVGGEFQRGDRGQRGQWALSNDRDRVRALQLLDKALPLVAEADDKAAAARFYLTLANALTFTAQAPQESWRLQALTAIDTLPDYETTGRGWRPWNGTPVDAAGEPIFFNVPKSWQAATSDGERWRWALAQAEELDLRGSSGITARETFAEFCRSLYGVETLAGDPWIWQRDSAADDQDRTASIYSLHTLSDDETIIKLATGIRRMKLPAEFNPIRLYQQLADDAQFPAATRHRAVMNLASMFENRRQYPRAAEYWRQAIELASNDHERQNATDNLEQITGNWGELEPVVMQPAGRGATLEYRFRNGRQVRFEAQKIDITKLLDDVKAYLKSNPRQLEWDQVNIDNIGYRLVTQNQTKYLGETEASWSLQLEPRANHFDRRMSVTTPLQKAGAYLVSAKLDNGNTSRIVVWLADTAIVQKPLAGKTLYYVADAASGAPVANANLEFFGYRQLSLERNRFQVQTANFAEQSDANGLATATINRDREQYQWLVIARTPEGRLAHLGFSHVWSGERRSRQAFDRTQALGITDRPIYRPGQPVHFKFWVREARFDLDNSSQYAKQKFQLEMRSPRGDKVLEKTFTSDEFAGFDGTYELPSDAQLGVYSIQVTGTGPQGRRRHFGSSSFRVEEYKKPEFEVTLALPERPIKLGDKATATLTAKYYFGAPVTQAKVRYKVTRTPHNARWFPPMPWDWLYGPGYWWTGYDHTWYPGWARWGCLRPLPPWWGGAHSPPELVADVEAEIGPDGTLQIEIDSALAKELHGDQDHAYQIVAEVTDQSRRTIVGQGTLLAAREPFRVFAWGDRGHYQSGDTITANFAANTLDGRPVQGSGRLRLLKVTYSADREPQETEVEAWSLDTDAQGQARQQLTIGAPGQYRLSYTLTDAAGHAIEGGLMVLVRGPGLDAAQLRFNPLELVADKHEYRPGDKVQLMINTDRLDGTVLLFVRPENRVYSEPQVIRLTGRSTLVELEVSRADMPNFFVEAVSISDARLHSEVCNIVVPPEQRVAEVRIEPSAKEYLPGREAEVKLTLTGADGKPFVGSTVLTIYDKAIEYISGGSNVPEIRSFFWKWVRSHYPQNATNLGRTSHNQLKPNEKGLRDLGIFGQHGLVMSELVEPTTAAFFGEGGGLGGGAPGRQMMRGAAAPEAAAMADGAAMEADRANAMEKKDMPASVEAGGTQLVQPTLRSEFADTALWRAAVTTDGDGTATFKLNMPENLTTWKIRSWAMGHGTRVGQGEAEVVTTKNLIVRLQSPRFFTETDQVVLSANVHNYLPKAKMVQVVLELDGSTLKPLDELVRMVEVPSGGEVRIDWTVKSVREGEAIVRMKALSDEESDAMQMTLPVQVHGMDKMESFAGALRPNQTSGQIEFDIPAARRVEQSRLEVRYSPSLAGAMVDALPYLVDYPYGCTEQTLNRFLPTVLVQKILIDMQLDLADIRKKRTNLNPQELGDDRERARDWSRLPGRIGQRRREPVFDPDEVARMTKEGVRALTEMQLSDGGWGWFSGWGEQSSPHTTAVVVRGLLVARASDVAIVPGVLERGVEWLTRYQEKQITLLKNAADQNPDPAKRKPSKSHADSLDAMVYMVLVDADVRNAEMLEFLDRDRTHLGVYAKAMFGLALHKQGEQAKLAEVMRNISQYVEQDDENQTAWLRLPDNNPWWLWHGSDIEAMSYYLKLLSRTDPQGELASRLVKYLLNNRRHATYWNSTRDTALAVEALADFFRASGQDKPDLTVEVLVDGEVKKQVKITADNLFSFDNSLVLEGEALSTGRHRVELRKSGTGPLYYNAFVSNFTLEEFIKRAGLEIRVDRTFYKLTPIDATSLVAGAHGQALDQKVEKYQRTEIASLGEVRSGDLVEIELVVESKNDYEYLMLEDMKAAGFEPVDLRSGYTGNSLGAFMELRDNRVVFFVRQLARGKQSITYRLRAEIPGHFSALPTRAEGMYAPELRANSDEMKIRIGQ